MPACIPIFSPMRLLCLVLLFPTLLSAQDFVDILELDYRLSPEVARDMGSSDKADISDVHARVLYPHVVDSSATLLISLGYDQLDVAPFKLHAITTMLGTDRRFGKKFKLLALAIPKISADLIHFGKRNIQIGGLAIVSKAIRDDFSWKLGVYANTDLFGPLLVPVIGFKWQASPSWRIDTSLPLSAHVRKTLSPKLIAGIKYSGRKYSYNLRDSDSYIEVGDNHVWAYADVYLAPTWVVHLRAGHSVLRNYALYPNEQSIDYSLGPVNFGDDRPEPSYERKNGFSLQLGIRYRYAID